MTRIRKSKLKNGKIYYWKFILLFLLLTYSCLFLNIFYCRWSLTYFHQCWWGLNHNGIDETQIDILDYLFINPLILSLVLSLILGCIITIFIGLSIKLLKFMDWLILRISYKFWIIP